MKGRIVDWMVTLTSIMLESQHKTSRAVDKVIGIPALSESQTTEGNNSSGGINPQTPNSRQITPPQHDPNSIKTRNNSVGSALIQRPLTPETPNIPTMAQPVPVEEQASYNAACLERIEGLLQTVVSRMDKNEPEVMEDEAASKISQDDLKSIDIDFKDFDDGKYDFDQDVSRWRTGRGLPPIPNLNHGTTTVVLEDDDEDEDDERRGGMTPRSTTPTPINVKSFQKGGGGSMARGRELRDPMEGEVRSKDFSECR
jgi:hypothetical protein